jgi:hypothetical protein
LQFLKVQRILVEDIEFFCKFILPHASIASLVALRPNPPILI